MLVKSFKDNPPFVDQLSCIECHKDDFIKPARLILPHCSHIYCLPCFRLKVENAVFGRMPDCCHGHWTQEMGDELLHVLRIDGYAEIDGEEFMELKRIFNGDDVDIRALDARHKPHSDSKLRDSWQRLEDGWEG